MEKKQVDNTHILLNSLDSEDTNIFHRLRTCHVAILRESGNEKVICAQEEENIILAEASLSLTQQPIWLIWHWCWAAPCRPARPLLTQLQDRRAQSQRQRHQWFNGWGSLPLWSEVLERHPATCGRPWAGQGAVFAPRGNAEIASYRGNWPRVTREICRGARLSPPLG